MSNKREYLRLAFDSIYNDVLQLLRYVEPCDDNERTYSYEIWSIYVRSCMELEAIFKQIAEINDVSDILSKKNPTILDYRKLEPFLGFEGLAIGVHFWRPTPKYVEPFAGWRESNPPVGWYSTYNIVKHDREENFHLANLGNMIKAFCGLFQAVLRTGIVPTEKDWEHFIIEKENGKHEAMFPRYRLSQIPNYRM